MQILVLLACFFFCQKLVKKTFLLGGGGGGGEVALGKGRVKDVLVQHVSPLLPTKDNDFHYQCLHLTWFSSHGDR